MSTWQIWMDSDVDGDEITLVEKHELPARLARWPGYLGKNPKLELEFDADTQDAARHRMHAHFKWGPYKPMEQDEATEGGS